MMSTENSLRSVPWNTVIPVPRMPTTTSPTGIVTVAAGSTTRNVPVRMSPRSNGPRWVMKASR